MRIPTAGSRQFKVIVRAGFIAAFAAVGLFVYLSLRSQQAPSERPAVSAQGEATDSKGSASAQELQTLQEHLQKKPGHTPILFRMAQLSREMGKTSEAAERLKEILRQEPDNLDARLELGRVLYELGDVAGAIEETERILAKNPQHVDALYNLGAIYANQNRNDLARQYWTQAVAGDPKSESGQNAQRGLQQLGLSTASFPERLRLTDLPRTSTANSPR
jgi:tetratricopeptide (TPR) repeat protein